MNGSGKERFNLPARVLARHEISDSGRQTTSTNTLNALREFAADPHNGLWLDTVDTIARDVIQNRRSSR